MDKISISSLGPIARANVNFGDLTLLIGPQASGKSVFLQILRLIEDKDYILWTLNKYGYVWDNFQGLLELYLGEGMSQVWSERTRIVYNGKRVGKSYFLGMPEKMSYVERTFYIPAQRVLSLHKSTGWPNPFSDYGSDDPFVLKDFSEQLRRPMNAGWINSFLNHYNGHNKHFGYSNVFYNGNVELDTNNARKRFVIDVNGGKIPYMSWSSGQKEYMPLWAGLALLTIGRKAFERNVIIEEPEMGLHPNAIKAIIIDILRLISLGYKIIISTHSQVFLEFAWAFKAIQETGLGREGLYELFGLNSSPEVDSVFDSMLAKQVNTYFFDRQVDTTVVKDISTLDSSSVESSISEWGGLSSFSAKAADIVLKAAIHE